MGPGVGGPVPTSGLTLPQVIALIDKRLVHLETITKDKILEEGAEGSGESGGAGAGMDPAILDEFNARFEIMAEEIANIKGIVLSLQSYTMNVNKMLLEERTAFGSMGSSGTGGATTEVEVVAPGVTFEPEGVNDDPLEEVLPQTPKWKKIK